MYFMEKINGIQARGVFGSTWEHIHKYATERCAREVMT